jgi:GxxExxY protein
MAVHTELGCGFLEAVYKAALAVEFRRVRVPFEREVGLKISYRGEELPLIYRSDFVCYGAVIVEVKAHEAITALDLAQTINYLRAARLPRGLLLNFGGASLTHRRVVWGGTGARRQDKGRPHSSLNPPSNPSVNPPSNPSVNPPSNPPNAESA